MLAKSKLNSIEALISKALIDSNIMNWFNNDFVLINKMLKNFYDMKNEIENFNDK